MSEDRDYPHASDIGLLFIIKVEECSVEQILDDVNSS